MAEVKALPDLPLARWPRPDGTYPEGPGVPVRDTAQLLQLIALGRAAAVLPETARVYLRDGLAAVPVPDAPAVDDGDRVAAAQPVPRPRRPGPDRVPPVTGRRGQDS